MPLSEEEQKQRNRVNKKKWYDANKDKVQEYRDTNKDKRNKYYKEYRLANKEKVKESKKQYEQSVGGKKTITINNWKTKHKILFKDKEEAEFYYETYINTHNCSWCDVEFINSKDRCLDHCHTCGVPRAIICRQCNFKDLVPCSMCLLQN